MKILGYVNKGYFSQKLKMAVENGVYNYKNMLV